MLQKYEQTIYTASVTEVLLWMVMMNPSAMTRGAVGMLDMQIRPEEVIAYIMDVFRDLGGRTDPASEIERAYLQTALAVAMSRNRNYDHFEACFHLESAAEKSHGCTTRLNILARYYRCVLELQYLYPHSRSMQIAPPKPLLLLANELGEIGGLASERRDHARAGVCLSLAAECQVRAAANPVAAMTLLTESIIAFHWMGGMRLSDRSLRRSAANNEMIDSGCSYPPNTFDFGALLYEPGEIIIT